MRLAVALLLAASVWAQQNPAATAARRWRTAHEQAIVSEFLELLTIPNLASDTPNIRRNAAAVSRLLEKRGVKTRLLETEGAPPVVYGEIAVPGATRTVIFYAHYDGQPLDPKEWKTPPWEPAIVPPPRAGAYDPESRIYARSASDDKAPILAIATALDAMRAAHVALGSNIKLVFEGEEEAGSRHLDRILAANQDLLRSDVWFICDGPVHQSRRQQIVFGARGVETLDITVYGPNRELHSGHYGNWAPNPAMLLARLLASMKDDDGHVLVEHYYDGIEPLSETEKRAVVEAPAVEADLKRELWLGATEGGGKSLVELLNLPSLNIRGMASSRIGAHASNVIPSTASASIDMRLVKGIDHNEAARRVSDHIRKQGFFIVDHDPDADTLMSHPKVAQVSNREGGYNAERTSMDLPISQLVLRTADSVRGPVVKLPTMGGSVPLYMISQILHTPTITIPIANHDNNQHSLRAMRWNDFQLLDYTAGLKLDAMFLQDSLDPKAQNPAHWPKVKERAAQLGLHLETGAGAVLPKSPADFDKSVQQLRQGIRRAAAMGSPVMRCLAASDRAHLPPGPAEQHIETMIKLLRTVRSEAMDAGLKIAIENHKDFQAWETRQFIEGAGKEFVGSYLDTGNPVFVLENPMTTLETLGPLAVTVHLRDSAIYEHPRGVSVQWVVLGDGVVDFKAFLARMRQICPPVYVYIKPITGRPPQVLPYLDPDFWTAYPRAKAADLAQFLTLAKKGHPYEGKMVIEDVPGTPTPPELSSAMQYQQRADMERSVSYAKNVLKLGHA